MRLEITSEKKSDRTILRLDGSLDLQSQAVLLSAGAVARDELAPGGLVELDLAQVSFIDSSGLGALVTLLHSYQDEDKHLALGNPSPSVARLLKLTALETVFSTNAP